MAETSGFFPDVSGDRSYTSDWLAKYIASFISNGTYDGELAVTADGSAMSVTLPSGRAWINGYHYRNDGNMVLPIDNADGVLNRKDIIVLRWDINVRSITAQVVKGTPASTAAAPAITRTAEQYDLKLAEISIPAGTTAITQALITDTRLDNSVCGIVTGVIKQVDTTTFYNQIAADLAEFKSNNEAGFTAWFNGIKDVLDSSTAGNLLNMIQTHEADKSNPHAVTAAQVGAPVLGSGRIIIPNSSDLNNYKVVGSYCVLSDANAQTLVNCPFVNAFTMDVSYANGDESYIGQTLSRYFDGVKFHRVFSVEGNSWTGWNNIAYGCDAATASTAGTAMYAHYPSHAIGLADWGLRGNYISTADPSGGNDGDTWDQY